MTRLSFVSGLLLAIKALAIPFSDLHEVNIRDENGHDVSYRFAVRYEDPFTERLSKRSKHPITCTWTDPETGVLWNYWTSSCDANDPQAYNCVTHYILNDTLSTRPEAGRCKRDQFCSPDGPVQAYCVDVSAKKKIKKKIKQFFDLSTTYAGTTGRESYVTAFFVTPGSAMYTMSQISMTALSSQITPTRTFWTKLNTSSCSNCYQDQMAPVPSGASKLVIDAVVSAGSLATDDGYGGTLYLAYGS